VSKTRRPALTDTHGNQLRRASKVAVAAVLERLVPLTCESRADYAAVYCEALGLSIVRVKGDGHEYGVTQQEHLVEEFQGPRPAIEAFWMLYKGKPNNGCTK